MRRALVPSVLLVILLFGHAVAQTAPWHVGVIVSRTGPFARTGALQAVAAERFGRSIDERGVFGAPLHVDVRDDRGDPTRTAELARELAAEGAVAVICCTTAAATERVAPILEAAGTPLLALAEVALDDAFWGFGLVPTDRARITAIAVDAAAEGKVSLGLMTLSTSFGDAAAESFARALEDAGREVAGEARYPADATVLTPEALWIATRQPGAVTVWGLTRDLPVALDGLRRRGFDGIVYARAEALPADAASRLGHATSPRDDVWRGLRAAVSPATLAPYLPPEHPHAAAVLAFVGRALAGDPTAVDALDRTTLARVDDALVWLLEALEQVAALGLNDDPTVRRQAVRDALVGAAPAPLAAGLYDASEDRPQAARWDGLVVARVDEPLPGTGITAP